jgi:hypothetical protein
VAWDFLCNSRECGCGILRDMELLHSFKVRWGGVNVELSASQLMYETGFAYMRKRETIPLKNISSISAGALAPTVTVKTTDGHELKISVGSASERDKFYAVLQGAVEQVK